MEWRVGKWGTRKRERKKEEAFLLYSVLNSRLLVVCWPVVWKDNMADHQFSACQRVRNYSVLWPMWIAFSGQMRRSLSLFFIFHSRSFRQSFSSRLFDHLFTNSFAKSIFISSSAFHSYVPLSSSHCLACYLSSTNMSFFFSFSVISFSFRLMFPNTGNLFCEFIFITSQINFHSLSSSLIQRIRVFSFFCLFIFRFSFSFIQCRCLSSD